LRPLAEYVERLPSGRRGKCLNRATLWRWALRGLRGGRRLQTAALGGTRVTCDAWVWAFLTSAPEANLVARAPSLDRTERQRVARRLGARTESRRAVS